MSEEKKQGYGFGTFAGVFTPSILTIIGVVMYLRFGWVLGQVGLVETLTIVTISSAITFLTGLSVSALATNMLVKGGGAYYMVSRSLGIEIGAAVGIPLFLSQAISVAFYVVGFVEAFKLAMPFAAGWDASVIGLVVLAGLSLLATFSASLAMKSQFFIMGMIALSLVSFFCGSSPELEPVAETGAQVTTLGFWTVLAVFFPAVTGILSGVGMSGDLKNPSRSLPLGTIAAVLVGWAVYMVVPIFLDRFVHDRNVLLTDMMVMQKCARFSWMVVAGIWAATLSSALGSLLAAPRTLQALAKDGAVPRFLGRGFGANNDPRIASALGVTLAAIGIWFGKIDIIAPVLTIFNLTVYALLNLSSALEEMMGNPAWRPSFRVPALCSYLGFAGCAGMMFMISPGATFIAAASAFGIWWFMSRRTLRSQWGDMRTGLLVFFSRMVLRKLMRHEANAHAWRPNLLVFSGATERRTRLVDFAGAISGNRSLTTYAAIVSDPGITADRNAELTSTLRGWLQRRGIDAQARVLASTDAWSGMKELIRTYGYGPLVPNTIIMGETEEPEFADAMMLAMRNRRNVVVLRGSAGELMPHTLSKNIDIWWRGHSDNASFMLALAYLIQRSEIGDDCRIRICHLQEEGEDMDAVRRMMDDFLAQSRVKAEKVVAARTEENAAQRIATVSGGSELVFLGLRKPHEGESAESYSEYLNCFGRETASMPQIVFACAAEDVDFNSIFRG